MNERELTRKLQDQLGFALKHDERQGWLVIEDDADDRCATITERVLWDALIEALAAPVAPAQPLTDSQLDALDTFALFAMAPRGRESVRQFARAVLAAAAQFSITCR